MRRSKHPLCSPIYEQLVLSRLKQSKATISDAKQVQEQTKKTVQVVQEHRQSRVDRQRA